MFVLIAHFRAGPEGQPPVASDGDRGAATDDPVEQGGGTVPSVGFPDDSESVFAIPPQALEPLTMLGSSPACRRLLFARSTESAGRYVLVAEFASAAAYRQALAPWPVRTVVVPWLSTAELEVSEVNEVLFAAADGSVDTFEPTVPHPGR